MNTRTQQITQEFYSLHPDLSFLQEELLKTFQLLSDTFRAGGKLLICGNGGSSADSEHIVAQAPAFDWEKGGLFRIIWSGRCSDRRCFTRGAPYHFPFNAYRIKHRFCE